MNNQKRSSLFKSILPCLMVGLYSGSLLLGITLPAGAVEDEEYQKIVSRFLQSCRENPRLSDPQKQQVNQIVSSIGRDKTTRNAAITEALRTLYPDFSANLTLLGSEETERAASGFIKLVKADDEFLAAESAFFLARAFLADDHHEEALPILQQLTSKWSTNTLRSGEALYLRGVSEAHLLKRLESILTLESYLKQNPTAPPRLRENAQKQLAFLRLIQDGSIADVHSQMEFSQRRLSFTDSGEKTQQTQQNIVDMLSKLIVLAEQQESSKGEGPGQPGEGEGGGQGGGGDGKGKSSGQLGKGANTKKDHFPGKTRRVQRSNRLSWEALQEKERNTQAFTALKNNFPARYRQLIQQYYRSFQEEEEEE